MRRSPIRRYAAAMLLTSGSAQSAPAWAQRNDYTPCVAQEAKRLAKGPETEANVVAEAEKRCARHRQAAIEWTIEGMIEASRYMKAGNSPEELRGELRPDVELEFDRAVREAARKIIRDERAQD